MKTTARKSPILLLCLLSVLVSAVPAQDQPADGPVYKGKSLSVWADEVLALNLLSKVSNTNRPGVQAIRAIGTNAIPWLLTELKRRPASKEQTPASLGLPSGSESLYHPLRARAGFWALGEIGSPAIPSLVQLLEEQPDLGPSALAGIGAPALPALEHCLTKVPPNKRLEGPDAQIVPSALGGLYVAIDVGRVTTNQAAYLLPTIRNWAESTNGTAGYWAKGVLRKMAGEN